MAEAVRAPVTVDFHAHHLPIGLPDMAARTGDARWPRLELGGCGFGDATIMRGGDLFRRVTAACHDPGVRLAELQAAGIDRQVISPVPVTLVDWAPAELADEFLRRQNDRLAEIAAESGGRLLALGAVPLQDPNRAVAELARIRDDLGMAGVEITAQVGGRELDAAALEPFWAAAEAKQVPVFIHPAHQATATRRAGMPYEFGIGMLTDTALAAAALIYGGVLARHPDLRIALAHGCGALPWVHPRSAVHRYPCRHQEPSARRAGHRDGARRAGPFAVGRLPRIRPSQRRLAGRTLRCWPLAVRNRPPVPA